MKLKNLTRTGAAALVAAAATLMSACDGAPPGNTPRQAAAPGSGPDLAALEASGALPPEADDTCGARKLAGIIGRPQDMPGLPEASASIRYLGPNSMATMDFSPQRLNIETDAGGRIIKLRCG